MSTSPDPQTRQPRKFRFVFRGEGILQAHARGERLDACHFLDDLNFTPEPLLAEPDMTAFLAFLRKEPIGRSRRTRTRQAEADRFLKLVQSSQADALMPEALAHLCAYLRGDAAPRRGAPIKPLYAETHTLGQDVYLRCLKRWIDETLRAPGAGVSFPEEAEWVTLPHMERVMLIVQRHLRDTGHRPQSIATLRNRIARAGYSKQLFVKAQGGRSR